jgi:uncharacterized protein
MMGMGYIIASMLELRPVCENCGRALPPDSEDARICSFECTFCAECVEHVLGNVCPNCGGGFEPRPIRPAHDWKAGNHVGANPPSSRIIHRPVDPIQHDSFSARLRAIPPAKR